MADHTAETMHGASLAQICLRRSDRSFIIDLPDGATVRLGPLEVMKSSVYPLLPADDRMQIEACVSRWADEGLAANPEAS
jgi:hypothetical protein